MAAVFQVLYRGVGTRHLQGGDVEIREQDGSDVRIGIRGNPVAGKRKVAWSQDAAPGILDMHVFDPWQISNITGHDHIQLVFHGACLAAVAHSLKARPLIGAKGDKQQHGPLIGQMAGQLSIPVIGYLDDLIRNRSGDRSAKFAPSPTL